MKPNFFENLFGSWPGALLLGGFGVVACLVGIAMFQQSPLPAVICMYGGILAVKHAVRLRSRVAHMREFGRQWARVAGWEEPPTRGVKGWLWWAAKGFVKVALGAGLGLLAYGLWGVDSSNDDPQQRNTVLVLFWGALIAFLAVMFRKHLYAFWLARQERKRRYEEGSEVDGKHLPRQFVEQALSIPMRSPGAAWFTQELPEHCVALLTRRAEAGELTGSDDDSIEDAPQLDSVPPRPARGSKFAVNFAGAVVVAIVGVLGWRFLLSTGALDQVIGMTPMAWNLYSEETLAAWQKRREKRVAALQPEAITTSNTPVLTAPPLPDRTEFIRWSQRVLGQSDSDAVAMWDEAAAGGDSQIHFSSFYLSKGKKAEANAWAQFTAARLGTTKPESPQEQPSPPAVASRTPDATDSAEQLYQRAASLRRANANGNAPEAISLFRRAAEMGHARAQFDLASYLGILALLQGKDSHSPEVIKWYRAAAENGVPEAQYELGAWYNSIGEGGQPSKAEARRWFAKGAAQGHALSMAALKGLGDAQEASPPAVASQTEAEKAAAEYDLLATMNEDLAKSRRAAGKEQEASNFAKAAADWRRKASEFRAKAAPPQAKAAPVARCTQRADGSFVCD